MSKVLPAIGAVLFLLALGPLAARSFRTVEMSASDTVPTTSVAEEPIVDRLEYTVELPTPEVEGLSGPVSRVLHAGGFLSTQGVSDLAGELPSSVVAVLIAEGVVLPVPETDKP